MSIRSGMSVLRSWFFYVGNKHADPRTHHRISCQWQRKYIASCQGARRKASLKSYNQEGFHFRWKIVPLCGVAARTHLNRSRDSVVDLLKDVNNKILTKLRGFAKNFIRILIYLVKSQSEEYLIRGYITQVKCFCYHRLVNQVYVFCVCAYVFSNPFTWN